MKDVSATLSFPFFSLLFIIFLTAGCVVDSDQQRINQQINNSVSVSIPPTSGIEPDFSIKGAYEIVKRFVSPQKTTNLTYTKTFRESGFLLHEFHMDDSSFIVNALTGRVQSATWAGSGPVISIIFENIEDSCNGASEFAKKKYPEIWVTNATREMNLKSARKWPLSTEPLFECAWFETRYFPDKKSSPHYTISNRNSVDIVINPSTGQIVMYEENYVPFNATVSLEPSVSEMQAKELAIQFLEKSEINNDFPTNQTSYGLSIFTDDDGNQNLVWTIEVVQHRNETFGGLIGIDAHDGHVIYHASF